jgi:hypothetical protein
MSKPAESPFGPIIPERSMSDPELARSNISKIGPYVLMVSSAALNCFSIPTKAAGLVKMAWKESPTATWYPPRPENRAEGITNVSIVSSPETGKTEQRKNKTTQQRKTRRIKNLFLQNL